MRFFLCSLLFFTLLSCNNYKNKRHTLIDYVPSNSDVVFKSVNLESLKNDIQNNTLFNAFSDTEIYTVLKTKLEPISTFNSNGEILLCLSRSKNDSIDYTLITKNSKALFETDSLKNYIEEQIKYKSHNIVKSQLGDNTFFSTVVDSTFIVSSSKNIITNSYNSTENSTDFKKLYDVSGNNESLSILLRTNNALAPSFFIEDALKLSRLTDFLTLDTEISQNDIFVNGIAKSLDSSKNVIDIFKNTVAQENQMQHITPGNSDGFLSFTFNNFKTLQNNILEYRVRDSISENETLFNSITEVGLIYEGEKRAVVLNSVDVIATQDALLGEQNKIETYRNIDVLEFSLTHIFSKTFAPLITNVEVSKYCILDNYFVFANSLEQLQNIIASYQNLTTLSKRSYFSELNEKLSSESSLIFVAKPELIKAIINNNLENKQNINIESYNLSAIQFIYDSNFAHVHGGLIKGKTKRIQNSISESFNIKLDTDILNTPQFVTNYSNNQKEIVVQDVKNTLYLISNKGKVVWKKQLNGPVVGEISQIDMYKNGRLQLAFATPNRVYVLDRKGRDVAPFPLKFKDNITQPLSVFDYDKNKKYRLLVTQGKNVLMYDARGKIVSGFTFKSAEGTIISQPKHFRIGTKDYLVIKTKNKLHILDRIGKTRVSPKTKNTFSNEPVFLYQNKFTTTSIEGKLVSIDTRGNVSSVNLNLGTSHNLETTSKTRVTLHDNKLGIKSRVLELDYGNYTRPNIFYINDKIYVTTTDLQSKKVYLYDSQGKLRPNFPVYGNSPIVLDDLDNDKNLEFITKGDSNTIILYKIN
ncbi:hypothetical protein [Jejuia pallidilutea]|uniref:Uncharacterized protein n=1 Tax=Jejuia pallidilutea TaxID=504487 RepID=A0A090X082_9FLAO|nr:hypothetical protein [Jejuia pallidilutea]GAL68909.1 hypothetical protein JCM19301_2928 [Jejuia pallidilutea]GAL72982.1 hypothetical protein JCM19302_259 [Jejuia pallidilutea]GAL91034.1 hypothetical protein JCM19538_2648 [Jejuia pallidilutea]